MKKLIALASIATMLFSCTKEELSTPNAEKLPINISVDFETRADDTSFAAGDSVGIYVVNYNGTTAGTLQAAGNQADNAKFTFDGAAWESENTIYWKDKSTATDFYAYYPYSSSVNIAAQPFAVKADQSAETNFWASDFLWGKSTNVAPTAGAVAIQTKHSLSRMVVNIKPGSGFTTSAWNAATKSVKICSVKSSAAINLATGVATATGEAGEIVPMATSATAFKAMMVPQTVAADSKFIVINVDGTDYVYRTGFTFKANTQHTFSVTINKGASKVSVAIAEWDIDTVVNEGTAIEEEKAAPIPDNEIWYTTTDGNIVTSPTSGTFYNQKSNTYTDGKGVIVFNSNVTMISANMFKGLNKLESVVIPDTVTEVGMQSFSGCSNLKSATLGKGVKYITENAFYDCNALAEIYCKATTPPTVDNSAALGNLYAPANKKIYVPTASVAAYKKASNWMSYSDKIYGYDF